MTYELTCNQCGTRMAHEVTPEGKCSSCGRTVGKRASQKAAAPAPLDYPSSIVHDGKAWVLAPDIASMPATELITLAAAIIERWTKFREHLTGAGEEREAPPGERVDINGGGEFDEAKAAVAGKTPRRRSTDKQEGES